MAIATDLSPHDTLYDLLPIGVMAMSQDRRITVWNHCLENWSSIPRSVATGRQLKDLFESYDDSKFSHRLDDVFESGAPVVLSAQFHGQVVPLQLPDGRNRIHQAMVTAMPGPAGENWALFALQDVTELTLQIQAFRRMREHSIQQTIRAEEAKLLAELRNEQLAEVNGELEQFAYLASHDLQEPLRTLTSFSTFLQADLGDEIPEAAQRDLEYIVMAAARMRRLIDDLLALSRVSRAEMCRSQTSLKECAEEALEMLESRVAEVGPDIIGLETLPTVMGDRRLLTQVFQNLLSNAMKFKDESRSLKIQVSAEHNGARWVIKTADNGIGIADQYLTKIFAPFQRLHGSDKYPGSGMGLAICKRAVERHGGSVWAVRNADFGSCFAFTLPDQEAKA